MNRVLRGIILFSFALGSTASLSGSEPPKEDAASDGTGSSTGSATQFFPDDVIDKSRATWYSKPLSAANERNLLHFSANKEQAASREAYRFIWLRSFHNPVIVHLEGASDLCRLVMKELDRKAGYKPGKILREKSRELTPEEWKDVKKRVEDCSFWSLATQETESYVDDEGETISWSIKDGAQWIVEGVRQGKYHIVDRQSPDDDKQLRRKLGKYRAFCLHLLRLGGFNLESEKVY